MTTEIRKALLSTCAALAKLSMRLAAMQHGARYGPAGHIQRPAHWRVEDIKPSSPWLEGFPGSYDLSAAAWMLMRVQVRLLAALASEDAIDPKWVCRVLLALGDEYRAPYSQVVSRFADRFGVTLPESPRSLHNGLGLRDEYREGEWLPQPVEGPARKAAE